MAYLITKRQGWNGDDGDDGDDGGYYSNTAIAIKWAFVGLIMALFLLWFIGGYLHAQRRIKKGLPPLTYHRFLLPYRQRVMFMPRPQYGPYPQSYGEGYPMQNYAPPPPAYHAEHMPPPAYQPPEGATKVDPSQDWVAAPPGPPPGASHGEGSSSSVQAAPLVQESMDQNQLPSATAAQGKKKGRFTRFNPFK